MPHGASIHLLSVPNEGSTPALVIPSTPVPVGSNTAIPAPPGPRPAARELHTVRQFSYSPCRMTARHPPYERGNQPPERAGSRHRTPPPPSPHRPAPRRLRTARRTDTGDRSQRRTTNGLAGVRPTQGITSSLDEAPCLNFPGISYGDPSGRSQQRTRERPSQPALPHRQALARTRTQGPAKPPTKPLL